MQICNYTSVQDSDRLVAMFHPNTEMQCCSDCYQNLFLFHFLTNIASNICIHLCVCVYVSALSEWQHCRRGVYTHLATLSQYLCK